VVFFRHKRNNLVATHVKWANTKTGKPQPTAKIVIPAHTMTYRDNSFANYVLLVRIHRKLEITHLEIALVAPWVNRQAKRAQPTIVFVMHVILVNTKNKVANPLAKLAREVKNVPFQA